MLSVPAHAGNVWIGGTAGAEQDWNNAGNWGGAFPVGNTTVNIGTGNFPVITADPLFTPVDLFVGSAGATGRVDHRAGTAATGNGNWAFVGQGALGNGTYNLADTTVTSGPTAGILTGFGLGTGSYNAGNTSLDGGRLIVGDGGTSTGVFNMNTSGTLKTEQDAIGLVLGTGGTSTGTFNLDGGTVQINSLANTGIAMLVGTAGGDGTFRMSGGAVNATGGIFVGDNNAGSQGLLEITGGTFTANTTGTNAQLGQHSIGRGLGQGTMNISGGSVALTGFTHIGHTATATAGTSGTLSISGGTFLNTGELRVGSGISGNGAIATGSGIFNVSAGTATITGNTKIGSGNDAGDIVTGTATVSNTGTLNSNGDLIVGYAGNANLGKLTLSDNATISVGATAERWVIVGQYDTVKGQFDITGGNLRLLNNTDIRFTTGNAASAASGVINQSGGTVTSYADATGTTLGAGVIDLQQSGATAAAANNTYNLDGGTLNVGQVVSSAVTGTRTFNFNGGTLKATGNNANFINLGTGNARANVRDNGAIIDSDVHDIAIPQSLEVSNVVGDLGTGGLTKLGTGKLTLGGANTYAGPTQVNAGTLILNGTSASSVIVGNQATLGGSATTSGSLTFNAGSTLAASTSLSLLANGVNFTGPTSLIFDGIPENGTEYVLFQYGAGGVTGLSNLSSTFRTVISDDAANQQVVGLVTTATINWNGTDGTWANGTGGWTGGSPSYFNGDTVNFNERPGPSVVTLNGTLLPAAVAVNNSTNPYTFTGTGSISGAGGLTKDGAGALTIETANSYSGDTVLNAGTLNPNSATALGTGTVVVNGGTLNLNHAAALSSNFELKFFGGTLNNTSGDPLALTPGTKQTWEGDFVFTGTDSLDMGNLPVTIAGSDENRTVTVSAGTLTVGEITSTFPGLIKQGAGTLEIASIGAGNGASRLPGSLTVAAGTLQFSRSNSDTAGSGDFTAAGLSGGGTLINGAAVERWFFTNPSGGSFDFTGTLANGNAGPLGFNKSGAGTQILSGDLSYTGQTTVGGGELVILSNNSGAGTNVQLNSGKLTLANTQTLGTNSLIRFGAALDLASLDLAADTDGTAYPIAFGTTTSATIISNRATPGAGINHTLTTQALANGVGGGTLTFISGANVTSGEGRITFTQFGLGAGTVQTTTLNPTTANVTVQDASKQNNNVSQVLGLGGTTTDNLVTGVISDGPALTAPNNVSVLKTDTSTWTLSGANTYTGTTTVSGGILSITQAVLADAAAVNLNTGGVLNLPTAGTDTVDRVFIDGVEQVAGTWGSLSSSATNKTALITGSGILLATNGAPVGGYGGWANAFGLDPLTDGAPSFDKDLDGLDNGTEYILGGSPVSGSDNAKIHTLTADTLADGDTLPELVMTIAVPVGTPAFPVGTPASAVSFEGYGIEVRGSTTLDSFLSTITPVDPVTTDLPGAPVQGGISYEYRSFSLGGSSGLTGRGFLQARVTNPVTPP